MTSLQPASTPRLRSPPPLPVGGWGQEEPGPGRGRLTTTDPSSGHVALQGRRRYYRVGHPALSNVSPTPMAQWEASERLWCSRKLQSPQALHGINEATQHQQ